jgi:UDP-xylose/UDP-N-acetylglucosamine transporter B4
MNRRYTLSRYLSVALVTFGIILCTFASAQDANSDTGTGSLSDYLIGISLLSFSLFASAYLGIMQERLYGEYGNQSREVMFVAHAIPLPGFLLLFSDLSARFSEYNADISLWWILLINTVLQYLCMRSVYKLQTLCSSLTVTLVITLRKFVSLIISIVYFQNPFTTAHWLGAACVFIGVILFSDLTPAIKTKKVQKAE